MDWQTVTTALPVAFATTFYALMCTTFLWAMRRHRPAARVAEPPLVSILKPLAGLDDGLRANLETFARVDYPAFEILFGVASRADPAVRVVEAFLGDHPELDAQLVITTPAHGEVHNPKVAQLLDLTRAARGSVLVVSDANVYVSPRYLTGMVGALARRGVGLVSSIIAGTGERTFGAALENAHLGAAVAPAIVTGHCLFGRTITVGKSMAMRRADLERVGGWESVGDVLAEDDTIGQRFHAAGFGVELSLDPVWNRNVNATALRTIDRHARWSKMRRGIVPVIFALEPLGWPLWVAAASWVVNPSLFAARLLACALLLQVIGALLCHTLLGARRPLLLALLEPARTAMAFAAWCLAVASRRVCWRGNVFRCCAGSKLSPVSADPAAAAERT